MGSLPSAVRFVESEARRVHAGWTVLGPPPARRLGPPGQPQRRTVYLLDHAAERNKVTDLGPCTVDQVTKKRISCPSYTSGDVSGQGQSNQEAERVMACDPANPDYCPGYPLGTFYGPKFLGVDATGKQVFLCTTANTGTSCVNGRTTTGGGPDAADYQVIGNANPDFTVGFNSQVNWNRFEISFLVRAAVGQDVFNNTALVYS